MKTLVKLLDTEPKEDIVAAIEALKAGLRRARAACRWSKWPAATRSSRGPSCTSGCAGCSTSGRRRSCRSRRSRRWRSSPTSSRSRRRRSPRFAASTPRACSARSSSASSIKIVGRKQVVGRPFLYGTTREFLERFGLNDLSDLPKVEDMSELLGFDLPAVGRRARAADARCRSSRNRREPDESSPLTTKSVHWRRPACHATMRLQQAPLACRRRVAARGRRADPPGPRRGQRPASSPSSGTKADPEQRRRSRSTAAG